MKIGILFSLSFLTLNAVGQVLYIGDSYSLKEGFGAQLGAHLRTLFSGQAFKSIASCGSSPATWVDRDWATRCGYYSCQGDLCQFSKAGLAPALNDLLEPKPKHTVIALGSNMILYKVKARSKMKKVTELVKAVMATGSKCTWIGPPQPAEKIISEDKFLKFVKSLEEASAPCKFIRSDLWVGPKDMSKDGIHPKAPVYERWFSEIKGRITE